MIRDRRGVRYENRFATIDGQTVVHCSLCSTFKPEENFRFVKAKKKLNSLCIDCFRKLNRERYIKNGYAGSGQKQKEMAWASRKRGDLWACTKCGVEKTLDQYNEMKSKYGTAPSHCKACYAEFNKKASDARRPILAAEAAKRKAQRMAARQSELLKCEKCGEIKPRSEWPLEGGLGTRVLKYCCSIRQRSYADVDHDISTQTKECSSCKLRKPFSDFSPHKQGIDGRQKTCKPCRSAKVHSGEWSGNKRRQATLNERSDGSITTELIKKMFSVKVCPCCDGWMERDDKVLDHIVPLKLGGGHIATNVMVLCWSCNSAKHAHHPSKWLQMLKPEAAERMRIYYSEIGLNFDT
jgi:5-methylcytosine-specific restriction endonuclease McrA